MQNYAAFLGQIMWKKSAIKRQIMRFFKVNFELDFPFLRIVTLLLFKMLATVKCVA